LHAVSTEQRRSKEITLLQEYNASMGGAAEGSIDPLGSPAMEAATLHRTQPPPGSQVNLLPMLGKNLLPSV
jgi:hypothetical protein